MANEKSLVIAVIGIVVLSFIGMTVWANAKPLIGNAMFKGGGGECVTFDRSATRVYTNDQLDNYCGSYCLGWNDNNGHSMATQGGNTRCCCDPEPLG